MEELRRVNFSENDIEVLQAVQKKAFDARVQAKAMLARDRDGAKRRLMMAKRYDQQIAVIRGGMDKLETLKMTLEQQQHVKGFVDSIGSGARMLKATNAQMDADDIGELMGDLEEEMAVATDVGDSMAQPLAGDLSMDAELEDELNQMTEEQALGQGTTAAPGAAAAAPAPVHAEGMPGTLPAMPSVPSEPAVAAPAMGGSASSGRVAVGAASGSGGGSGGDSPAGFEDLAAMMS